MTTAPEKQVKEKEAEQRPNQIKRRQEEGTSRIDGGGCDVIKPTTVTALSFPCRRVRIFTPSGALMEEVESDDVLVSITDFKQSSVSILEVTAPSRGTESLLTTAIGSRLAFCRVGDCEVQIFCTSGDFDKDNEDGVENSSSDPVSDTAKLEKICRLLLTSSADTERLTRSMLLRVVRLFMESAGILKELEGKYFSLS